MDKKRKENKLLRGVNKKVEIQKVYVGDQMGNYIYFIHFNVDLKILHQFEVTYKNHFSNPIFQ